MLLPSQARMAVDSIQVAFRRVALSYIKGVLIYKAGRQTGVFVIMGQFFCERDRHRSQVKRGEVSCSTVAVGDFSELGGGHIDMLFERAVKCRL